MKTLSPSELTAEWAGKKTRPVCCLTGEERALKETALASLPAAFNIGAFNFSEYDAETADIGDLVSAAMTPGLMCDKRIIVLRGAEKLKKEPAAALAAYVAEPSDAAMLVILLDKRTDAADLITGSLTGESAVAHFAPLESASAARYAKGLLEKDGLTASEEALELLAETCSFDASTIRQETAKLAAWRKDAGGTIGPGDVMESAGFSRTLNPFEFANAVQGRNGALACGIADKMMAEGTEPIAITVTLAHLVEKLLKVKTAAALEPGGGFGAAGSLGMNPGYYRRLLGAASGFTPNKLSGCLHRCLEVESMLKSSSGRDPKLLVRQLIFEITR